jgi:hypothetical protein
MRPERHACWPSDLSVPGGFERLEQPRPEVCLSAFYSWVPFQYPRLFEHLALEFFWQKPEVGQVEFAANPSGRDLSGLADSVRYDPHLWNFLVGRGYLIFGRMSGGRYDPVAFDVNARKGHDAPVVRVDHEEILSFVRLGRPTELAPSFRAFLERNVVGAHGAA